MKIIEEIKKRLAPLQPYKVILFGSYAKGEATENSDIDLYIITNEEFIPQTWQEKKSVWLPYSKALRDLQKKQPIDIIVHTKAMAKKFFSTRSLFAQEVKQGKEL